MGSVNSHYHLHQQRGLSVLQREGVSDAASQGILLGSVQVPSLDSAETSLECGDSLVEGTLRTCRTTGDNSVETSGRGDGGTTRAEADTREIAEGLELYSRPLKHGHLWASHSGEGDAETVIPEEEEEVEGSRQTDGDFSRSNDETGRGVELPTRSAEFLRSSRISTETSDSQAPLPLNPSGHSVELLHRPGTRTSTSKPLSASGATSSSSADTTAPLGPPAAPSQATSATPHTGDLPVASSNQKAAVGEKSDTPDTPPEENGGDEGGDDEHIKPQSPAFYLYIGICVFLLIFAGLMSGLTVGLMSIDPLQMRILESEGTDVQKAQAKRVSSLIHNHHLLLVTLLLCNAAAMEALPIFLDRLVPAWIAIVLSVTGVLFVGEVLPQALCTGKYQLAIGASAAPLVWCVIFVTFFISWPLAKLLDFCLGVHNDSYWERSHLKALIRLHGLENRAAGGDGSGEGLDALERDEVLVIEGALDLAKKNVEAIMVPIGDVYMLEWETRLTTEILTDLVRAGHSRVPVYRGRRENVVGVLLSKQLIVIDPNAGHPVKDFVHTNPIVASPDASIYDTLNRFQVGLSHICLISRESEEYAKALEEREDVPEHCNLLGIVTLEDVIEELIQEPIFDEFDPRDPSTGRVTLLDLPKKLQEKRTTAQRKRSLERHSAGIVSVAEGEAAAAEANAPSSLSQAPPRVATSLRERRSGERPSQQSSQGGVRVHLLDRKSRPVPPLPLGPSAKVVPGGAAASASGALQDEEGQRGSTATAVSASAPAVPAGVATSANLTPITVSTPQPDGTGKLMPTHIPVQAPAQGTAATVSVPRPQFGIPVLPSNELIRQRKPHRSFRRTRSNAGLGEGGESLAAVIANSLVPPNSQMEFELAPKETASSIAANGGRPLDLPSRSKHLSDMHIMAGRGRDGDGRLPRHTEEETPDDSAASSKTPKLPHHTASGECTHPLLLAGGPRIPNRKQSGGLPSRQVYSGQSVGSSSPDRGGQEVRSAGTSKNSNSRVKSDVEKPKEGRGAEDEDEEFAYRRMED
uniref:CNNM transmembrane domain-containing protein n=1 Tax=Chromera velia CCMP2878 TaxID=1169474 RepID=A0A0G4HPN7_9ALVE|eukprot:Cvel_7802.t1-p1 / transcript=Cvel_7802.t1 / gene=Cvel_7802 / organism=Chromera_velia_CCMP2878 / gene_product=DUF21 domain-containing protein At4g33700, putative / transcript_product=DUF21 domain-containing protein At4g33700, putative / location=Cvel_scaffold416:22200-34959(-) / protein_length=1034 / sequence_SO=supercontig / SO=protein_coding / is_pseudo=false